VPSWFHFRSQIPPEDPNVARVEEILEAAASRSAGEVQRRDGRVVVTHAVWLCACETLDDSPLWLIYAVGDDGVGWQRITDYRDASDVVEADHLTGAHPDPEGVLKWLRADWPAPWRGRGDFPEDDFIYEELLRRIRLS
jgi:hypothetical protein